MIKFFLSLLVLVASAAEAAPKKYSSAKRKQPAYLVEKQEFASRGMILDEPARNFSLVGETGMMGFGNSLGLSVAYHLTPDYLIEGFYSQTKHVFRDLDTKSFGLRLRAFFGRTLNVAAGFAQQDFEFSTDETYTNILVADTPRQWSYSATADRTALDLSIGNRWSFRYFTIGCDWAGFLLPLRKGEISSQTVGTPEEPNDLKDAKSDMEDFVNQTDLQLLRLHIGVTF